MKSFDSELYGKIKQPESIFELLKIIIGRSSENQRNVNFWRGQSSIDWKVDSGAFRRLTNHSKQVTEREMIYYEESLLKRARHKGHDIIEGRTLSDMELLSRLQHHGASTRLVDFSKNSLVALWFCVNSLVDKTGLLLGVSSNQVGGGVEGTLDENYRTYSEAIKDLSNYNHPMFIEVPVVSDRISAQHGVFLFSDISNKNTGSFKLPEKENVLIAITPQLKKQARKVLIESFNIRTETLFPDLDGFSLANNVYENPSEVYRW